MKITVGNLAQKTTEPSLRKSFEHYGAVSKLDLELKDGRPVGSAFVEMSSREHGRNAISGLNGKDLDGNRLEVTEAKAD